MIEKIEGVFLVTKNGTMVKLVRPGENADNQSIDYFSFQTYLFKCFEMGKINKICEYLNGRKQVIIDFDNERAMLVQEKDPNFMSVFIKEMSPENVVNFYFENDGNMGDNNYIKPNLGDDQYVESIYRRQTNS